MNARYFVHAVDSTEGLAVNLRCNSCDSVVESWNQSEQGAPAIDNILAHALDHDRDVHQ